MVQAVIRYSNQVPQLVSRATRKYCSQIALLDPTSIRTQGLIFATDPTRRRSPLQFCHILPESLDPLPLPPGILPQPRFHMDALRRCTHHPYVQWSPRSWQFPPMYASKLQLEALRETALSSHRCSRHCVRRL